MRGDPGEGSPRTLRKPKFLRSPIKPFVAVRENAREYPQQNHCKTTTALLAETAQISDKADFRLASPEYKNAEFGYDVSKWLGEILRCGNENAHQDQES
jgi:hypothetical protein